MKRERGAALVLAVRDRRSVTEGGTRGARSTRATCRVGEDLFWPALFFPRVRAPCIGPSLHVLFLLEPWALGGEEAKKTKREPQRRKAAHPWPRLSQTKSLLGSGGARALHRRLSRVCASFPLSLECLTGFTRREMMMK